MTNIAKIECIDGEIIDTEDVPSSAMEPRDLVYQTDRWTQIIWEDALEEEEDLARAVARFPGTEWPAFVREVFARLYGRPDRLPEVALGGEWAAPLHGEVESLREWQELEVECAGDDDLAASAAAMVALSIEPPPGCPPQDPRRAASAAAEEGARAQDPALHELEREQAEEAAQAAHAECVGRIRASQEAAQGAKSPGVASAVRRSVRPALVAALEHVREARAVVALLGCGVGPSREERIEWRRRIVENREILEIAKLAGRMEALIEADQAQVKSDFGRDDITGVKLGGSLGDAVPMERALFAYEAAPEIALLQVSKLVEGRLLQNRQVGLVEEERAGRGPLIFACDESSSMLGGTPFSANVVAKAIMLTLMRRCSEEQRTFAVVHWSTSHKESVWPRGEAMNADVVDVLTRFQGGGTDLPMALRTCASIVRGEQPKMPKDDAERADVVLLTDAAHYEHGETQAEVTRLKATGARLFTFHVNHGVEHEVLKKESLHYMKVDSVALDGGAEIALAIHRNLKRNR